MPHGDNKEFTIPNVSDGDVTIYFFTATGTTSDSDTATTKYMNTSRSRTEFCLRSDQVVQIVQLNDRVLTDPYTCPKDGSITETELQDRRYTASYYKMVIRPTVNNTNIKLRVRG
ncbi:MAG: hypothetical protein ACTSX6_04785 [Candidatus Heimdallarchaeaceae archaeon]